MLGHGEKSRRGGAGSAPVRGGAPVCSGRVPGGRGARLGRDAHDGVSVVSDLGATGPGRTQGGRPPGSQAASGSPAAGPDRPGTPTGTHRPRVCDRSVDLAANGHGDRTSDGPPVSPGACLADPAAPELVAPAAGAPGDRARRGGDSPVGPSTVARGKKNGDGPAARPTLHHENRLSSPRVRRSETARSFGTASPQKNCRGSFRDPAVLPLSTPSKVVRRTLLRAPAPLHGG